MIIQKNNIIKGEYNGGSQIYKDKLTHVIILFWRYKRKILIKKIKKNNIIQNLACFKDRKKLSLKRNKQCLKAKLISVNS